MALRKSSPAITFREGVLTQRPKELTDMTINVGSRMFRAHKLVMRDSSPVFRRLIINKSRSKSIRIKLDEQLVDVEIVSDLLNFLYTGTITLTAENVYSICKAADYLEISSLLPMCGGLLSKTIFLGNVLDLLLFSQNYGLEELQRCCSEYANASCEKLFADFQLFDYNIDNFQIILAAINTDRIDFDVENVLFTSLTMWIQRHLVGRSPSLAILTKCLSLYELLHKFLSKIADAKKVTFDFRSCSELIDDAQRQTSLQPETGNLLASQQFSQTVSSLNSSQESREFEDLRIPQQDEAFSKASVIFTLDENPLLKRLHDYRVGNKFTDITLHVGRIEFHSHKLILSESSPVLKEIITKKPKRSEIKLNESFIDLMIVEELFGFFYKGKITLHQQNVRAICITADYLKISSLLSACERLFCLTVSPANALELLTVSHKYGFEELRLRCSECVNSNCKTLLQDLKLFRISIEEFSFVLQQISQDDIDFDVKEVLLNSYSNWIEEDFIGRPFSLERLQKCISTHELLQQFANEVAIKKCMAFKFPSSSEILNNLSRNVTLSHTSELSDISNARQ